MRSNPVSLPAPAIRTGGSNTGGSLAGNFGYSGGGGGSFLTSTYGGGFYNLVAGAADVTGNGYVSIEDLTPSSPATPEPASLALLGAGLAGIGAIRRRRR